jgi:hypothetical protein
MKIQSISRVVVALCIVSCAGMVSAQPACPGPTDLLATPTATAQNLQFDQDMWLTANTQATAVTQKGGALAGNETKGNLACDWFDISCSNGSSDSCCGSVGSCLGYCSEVCGGPCIYVEN